MFLGATWSGNSAAAISLFARLDCEEVEEIRTGDNMDDFAAGGSIEVAQLIFDEDTYWDVFSLSPALERGHLPFVQWAFPLDLLDEEERNFAVMNAVQSGSTDLVRWLAEERGCTMCDQAIPASASAGNLDLIQWLHGQPGCDLQRAVNGAARYGQLHLLEWLIAHGYKVTEEALYKAAKYSTVDTVAWFLDRGCPYVEEKLVERALGNNSAEDIIKFLIETKHMSFNLKEDSGWEWRCSPSVMVVLHQLAGRPLHSSCLAQTAREGDIGLFRYGLLNGAPLNASGVRAMIEHGECAMLTEALEHFSVDGTLAEAQQASLDEGMNLVTSMCDSVAQTLEEFGCCVPAKFARR